MHNKYKVGIHFQSFPYEMIIISRYHHEEQYLYRLMYADGNPSINVTHSFITQSIKASKEILNAT